MNVAVMNILDMIRDGGERTTTDYLDAFSCKRSDEEKSLNQDIEDFLKNSAIQFAKQKVSVSYVVIDLDDNSILGYFTIAHKALQIPASGLSNTTQKKMERYAVLDRASGTYAVSAFLIAQFGKNYAIDGGNRITGAQLMEHAENVLDDLQHRAGGGVEYLDCEPHAGLIRFYEGEGFRLFGERFSEKDGRRYLQYMRFF